MSNEQEQKKAVDHVAEAREYVQAVAIPHDEPGELYAAIAQVHASLAIAEELRAANGWLENIANELSRAQS